MLDIHLISYYIGISIIILTHVWLIFLVKNMGRNDVMWHSIVNIIAIILIAYYFLFKEGFIKF